MKKALLFLLFLTMGSAAWAQSPTPLTIADIQTHGDSLPRMAADADTSIHNGELVETYGVITFEPSKYYSKPGLTGFFIQDSANAGPRNGLFVITTSGDTVTSGSPLSYSNDLATLQRGNYVRIIGEVTYFNGQVQLNLDHPQAQVNVASTGIPVDGPSSITPGTLNDTTRTAVESGDKWESSYVELTNVDVINTNSSDPSRNRAEVQGPNGNTFYVWDGNIDQRNSQNGFEDFSVGQRLDTVRGVVYHRAFNDENGHYEVWPTDSSDVVVGAGPPRLSELERQTACPGTESVTVTVNAEAGTSPLDAVRLYYNHSGGGSTPDSVAMTETVAGTYEADIPASFNQSGRLVYYYAKAIDDTGNSARIPRRSPVSYTVNDNGCTISDIQRVADVIFPGQNDGFRPSGYEDMTVTDVTGVVTSVNDTLGTVHIQEPNASAWGGIEVTGGSCFNNLERGDQLTVSGTVTEFFGQTQLQVSTQCDVSNAPDSVTPPTIDPGIFANQFATHEMESYEGMLVRFEDPDLQVVDPAINPNDSKHEADYRIGTDSTDPQNGVRFMAGYNSSEESTFSSEFVPYVNDSAFALALDNSVTPCIVTDSTSMAYAQGIVNYQWNEMKVLPRSAVDFGGVQGCRKFTDREERSFTEQGSLRMYPNPATHSLQFRVQGQDAVRQVVVYDLQGRRVLNRTQRQGIQQLNLSNLTQGTYMVRVMTRQGQVHTQKLIKQ